MSSVASRDGPPTAGLARLLCLLFLTGVAMRMTLLAIPPVIPLIHDELSMSETQIGLLVGLPLAMFAVAAVPGSLLIARVGASLAATIGMALAAAAGALRGAATGVLTLYAAAVAAGIGIAVMQPGLPKLVREWMPTHIALGTIAYSGGMVIGATLPPILTGAFVLPLVEKSWRLDLALWGLPAALIALTFFLLSPRDRGQDDRFDAGPGLWRPDWKNPLVWLLGLTFGSNSGPFFVANAFLGDYLASRGLAPLFGPALSALNGAQIAGLVVLIMLSDRLHRRVWPFLLFGPALLAAFLGLIFVTSPIGIIVSAGLVGISTAVTMAAVLALPPLLVAPADVSRTSAGMLTITYACAIIIPTICGALWDLTGEATTAFVLPCICSVGLTVLGAIVARYQSATEELFVQQG